MQYRKLGSSDLAVSRICLGTMTFGNQNTEAEFNEKNGYVSSLFLLRKQPKKYTYYKYLALG